MPVAALPDGRVVTAAAASAATGGCWWGTRPSRAQARSSSAATSGGVNAVAVLPDGRVVTGGGDRRRGRVLVGDPQWPGAGPVEVGVGRVLVWDPAQPGAGPVELGRDQGGVNAVAVLPDGRLVTGGDDGGRVLVWDPAQPGASRSSSAATRTAVQAVAVLPDGRLVTGGDGDRRVLVWDPGAAQRGPVEPGIEDAVRPRWRRCRTGGWSPASATSSASAGCWCGTRPSPRPPGRARPPLGRGHRGGGVAGRAGGHRQRRTPQVLVWDPAQPGAGQVELGRYEDGVGRWRRCRTGGWSPAAAAIRGGGGVLVWDPAEPGACPVELGGRERGVTAVAVLPDGRVVTGGDDRAPRRRAGAGVGPGGDRRRPGRLGRDKDGVTALAALPDGRVVTGDGYGGRVLVWDPAEPGASPVEARPR